MSNTFRQTITALEQELDAIHQRAGEIQKAIEILEPMADPEEDDDAPTARPRGKAAKGNSRGPAADVGDKSAAILATLKKHGGVMKPGELAKALKLEPGTLRYQLKPLEKAKQVVITGVTAGRRVSLPGAKEVP